MGCKAFKARGSIDEKELVAFIAEHEKELTAGGVALRDQKLAEEIRKLRLRNDKDDGKVVSIDIIKQKHSELLAKVDMILEQKLVNEYPAIVAGLDIPSARMFGKKLGDSIREEFQALEKIFR